MKKKFRKKPIEIEAEQYIPGKPCEGVTECPNQIIFSRDGKLFYLQANGMRADCWLSVEPGGNSYPFSMYEIKSGDRRSAIDGDTLVERYLTYMREDNDSPFKMAKVSLDKLPPPYAYVTTIHGQNTQVVEGDWIVPEMTDPTKHYPVKPDVMEKTYDPVE